MDILFAIVAVALVYVFVVMLKVSLWTVLVVAILAALYVMVARNVSNRPWK